MILTGGIEASKIDEESNIKTNGRGQFIVNEYLQTQEYENIFAIGDVAEIKNSKGEIMPPNVTIARITGTIAGKNILNILNEKDLIKCNLKLEGILIALGGKYAVGDLYGIVHVKGILAYLIKKYVFSSYRDPLLKLIKIGYSRLKKQ